MITEDTLVTRMRETEAFQRRIDKYREQLEDGATRAEAVDLALVEERSKRRALSGRLISAESVASKEIARIKKQSELQEAELKRMEKKGAIALEERRLFREAIGRVLHSMNEERAAALTEREEEGEEKKEKEKENDSRDEMCNVGICFA